MNHSSKRVAVAMSGGVDSSVAALLLLQQGYDVLGVTMVHMVDASLYSTPQGVSNRAAEDAAAVCRHLGIRHEIIDLRQIFSQQVIQKFLDEYLAGRTPNPCVFCNRMIKWGELAQWAHNQGAAFFATGHYARIELQHERFCLRKGANLAKDQSYALWRLTQEQLGCTLFPLGELAKEEVRRLAREALLPVAHKSESQDICFIPDDDYPGYICRALSATDVKIEEGEIVDQHGRVVGRHRGYPFYTIGQRKGLGVALGHPVYVTRIDVEKNRIVIGEKTDLMKNGLVADSANWIAVTEPPPDKAFEARIRYKDPGYPCRIESVQGSSFTLRFLEPRPAITPGQSAVIYDGDLVVGGGIIQRAI